MKIKVNGQEIEIFSGARVKDALLKYSGAELKLVKKNKKKVCVHYSAQTFLRKC